MTVQPRTETNSYMFWFHNLVHLGRYYNPQVLPAQLWEYFAFQGTLSIAHVFIQQQSRNLADIQIMFCMCCSELHNQKNIFTGNEYCKFIPVAFECFILIFCAIQELEGS